MRSSLMRRRSSFIFNIFYVPNSKIGAVINAKCMSMVLM